MARKPQLGALETMFETLKTDLEKIIKTEVSASVRAELKKQKGAIPAKSAVAAPAAKAAKTTAGARRGRKPKYTTCTIAGCSKPHYAKGMCSTHYQQARLKAQDEKAKKTKAVKKPKPAAKKTRKPRTARK